jgi:hypothetical protein
VTPLVLFDVDGTLSGAHGVRAIGVVTGASVPTSWRMRMGS